MTQINIDKDWMVTVDQYGNHVPHRWKQVYKRIEGGGLRDTVPTGEYAWYSENKFFPNMLQVLQYIFQRNMLDNIESASIEDYCQLIKDAADYFDSLLSKHNAR